MIQIVSKPTRFTPAGNPVIWQVKTDNSNIIYFRVVLYDDDTTTVINQLNAFTTPQTPMGSYLNLNKLLENVVRWEVNNDSLRLVVPMQKTVRAYRLKITEFVLSSTTGVVEAGDEYDTSPEKWYTWNAELGRITAQNFNQNQYVVSAGNVANFLTTKPNFSRVNDFSAEHLSFLQDGTVEGLKVRIRTYNGAGELLDTVLEAVPDLDTYQMYRCNVSPKALTDSSNLDFTNVNYYVVDLVDNVMTAVTTERVYYYKEVECWLDMVNVMWVNPLGGIDSYQFVAPQDRLEINRVVMKRNTLGVNATGVYDDFNDGVFNPSDVIVNSTATTITKMTSRELSDKEAYWLQTLFTSKQVFVELTDMTLVPALLQQNSYNIVRPKYNRGTLNTTTIDLILADGVIPVGFHAYATRIASIQFIDSQMGSVGNNLPGYDITSGIVQQRHYNPDSYTSNYA